MNQDVKERWVKHLRSGEFQQARRQLVDRENNSFCCLGVLIKTEASQVLEGEGFICDVYADFGLPRPARMRLVEMNDVERKSFLEIADYIEKVL